MLTNTKPAPVNSGTLCSMNSDLSPSVQPPPCTHTTSGRSSQSPSDAGGVYTSRLVRFGSTPGTLAYAKVSNAPHDMVAMVGAGAVPALRSAAHADAAIDSPTSIASAR